MRSMEAYPRAAMERAMKVQDVMLQAMAKKITWWQAAEILGISDRHMRRIRERYEEEGYKGLLDRRGQPSRRRVPVVTVEISVRLVPGKVFRSERAALSREVAGRARDRAELHLGEAGAAGSGAGGARTQARGASQTERAAAVAVSLTHGPHCLGRYDGGGALLPAKASTALSRGRGTAPFPCNPIPKINPTQSARAQL
jgi:hypothetical protein